MDMIEKAARAIAGDEWFDFTEAQPGDAESFNGEWMDKARAVIEAIREPSPEMALAGRYAIPAEPDTSADTPEAAADCWRVMIDTILNPGKQA